MSFRETLNSAVKTDTGLYNAILKKFSISKPTLERWLSGANEPHPAMMKHIYEWLEMRGKEEK